MEQAAINSTELRGPRGLLQILGPPLYSKSSVISDQVKPRAVKLHLQKHAAGGQGCQIKSSPATLGEPDLTTSHSFPTSYLA